MTGRSLKFAVGCVGVSFCLAILSPAHAQTGADVAASSTPAPPSSNAIVVEGQRADRATIDHQAMSFEREFQATPVQNQLARWNVPICPIVNGLDQRYADYVATKIREIAKSANVLVAGETCRPNIFVTFTNDGPALVKAIEHVQPRTLYFETLHERKVLRASDIPVRWWYGTELDGSEGEDTSSGLSRTFKGSLISTNHIANITGAAVIIDASRATGYRLDAVASYAAFVALGHFRVDSPASAPSSIMGLFDRPPTNDDGMTKWDVAYLSALYATQADRTTDTERHRIAGKMVNALAN